jgi:hypothetical protein
MGTVIALLLLPAAISVSLPPLDADSEARARFAKLTAAEKQDLADYLRSEAVHLETFQASLVAFVLGQADRDPKTWPEEVPAAWFDSREHTPENDIPRHAVDPESSAARAVRRTLLGKVPAPRFDSAFRYDYGSRSIVRKKDWKSPERVFANALKGAAPDLDLAEALVEKALDDGAEQKALAAFGHCYTDRDGGAYTTITLYDAWGSGAEFETPDVDTLGIVHTVLGDWKTWRAPVDPSRHDKLFDTIGGIFVGAQRHRGLRHALAMTYLEGSAVLGEGYQASLDNLHALWEDTKSTPADLLPRLPASAKRDAFLATWVKRCKSDKKLWAAAVARHRTLDADGEAVRALVLRLLDEFSPRKAR